MFFSKAVAALVLTVSALALHIPHTDTDVDPLVERGEPWLSGTQSGEATFYDVGLGACGIINTDSDYVTAVSIEIFDNYPGYTGGDFNDDPVCNNQITASYEGNSVTITVVDRCTGCGMTDLDLSPTAFQQLAPLSAGRIPITWVWS